MAAPTYTPLPTAPSRTMTPTAFAAAADAFVAALAAFQTEGDTLGAYTQTQAEAALAAAIAGNLSELDLTALAGWVIGVNSAGDALEGVELVPSGELFQSKQVLASDTNIDFTLASGVDEHIFNFVDLIPTTANSVFRMQASDDSLSTFENTYYSRSSDGGSNSDISSVSFAALQTIGTTINANETGLNGRLILTQLSGAYAHYRWEAYSVVSGVLHSDVGMGIIETTSAITELRFFNYLTVLRATTSGEIRYSTKTYA